MKVSADVLQVVVFPAGSDAFLTVDDPPVRRHVTARVRGPQEDRLKLVHAGVDEQQARVSAGPDRAGRDQQVSVFLLEEVKEEAPDPRGGQRRRKAAEGAL